MDYKTVTNNQYSITFSFIRLWVLTPSSSESGPAEAVFTEKLFKDSLSIKNELIMK